ncbi:MAG: hypothetical protein CSA70_01540 [Rhodobacterales bacterium]|nr:MAG: hypothetical protein CSA70_01540 [Rhodobacterales bacterium]
MPRPAQSLPVYRSADLRVVNGANMGDGLSFAADLVPDDLYELSPLARRDRLSLHATDEGRFTVAEDTTLGTPGAQVILDSCLTFMGNDGGVTDMLLLVEVDEAGHAVEVYGLPLATMMPQTEYHLVGVDRDAALSRLAQVACVSFTRGTHITMATGEQRRIEELQVGDRVLTRDDGPQEIRWIGQNTLRAVGELAPILISAGTLNNENDLLVSPDHRLFVYQRSDALGAGRSEILVKARHLVNGDTVTVRKGGFVDYFQLLFDAHQIIYAEGIAAETLLIDPRTKPALPSELAAKMGAGTPGHADAPLEEYEVSQRLVNHPDAAERLRRASTG